MRYTYTILAVWLWCTISPNALHSSNFRIQLAAFVQKVPFTHFAFAGVNNVYLNVDQNNIYRYYLRTAYLDKNSAEQACLNLIDRGFCHARVVDVAQETYLCGEPCPYLSETTTFASDETEHLLMEKIYFGFDRSALRYADKQMLDELIVMMNSIPNLKARIWGHTDALGTAEYNVRLSKRRARAVRNYLIGKGIPITRIDAIVFGESAPALANKNEKGVDNPESRRFNRRVVIALYNDRGEIVSADQSESLETEHPRLVRSRR